MNLLLRLIAWPLAGLMYVAVQLLLRGGGPNASIARWAAHRGWNFADLGYRRLSIVLGRLAVRDDPSWPGGYRALGHAFEAAGNRARARATYRRGLDVCPTDTLLWHHLGALVEDDRDYKAAEDAFLSALRTKPDDPLLLVDLAGIVNFAGRHSEAETLLLRAQSQDPNVSQLDLELGRALASQGRNEDAEPYLRRAVGSEPDSASAHYYLAVVLSNLGRRKEAQKHASTAARLNPLKESYAEFARVARAEAEAADS